MKRTYEISAPRLVIPLYQNPLSCQQPVNRIQTIDRKTGSQPTAVSQGLITLAQPRRILRGMRGRRRPVGRIEFKRSLKRSRS